MEINSTTYPALPPQAVQTKAPRKADADQPPTANAAALSASASPSDTVETGAAEGQAAAAPTSGAKAFAYGVLGIERPDDTTPVTDHSYNVGNWTGAGLKIGGLIALLV